MSSGRRCRRSIHQRESGGLPTICDECGQAVPDTEIAVLVGWIDRPNGPEPDWAFVGHRFCAGLVAGHISEAHGLPVEFDEDESWLRRAIDFGEAS